MKTAACVAFVLIACRVFRHKDGTFLVMLVTFWMFFYVLHVPLFWDAHRYVYIYIYMLSLSLSLFFHAFNLSICIYIYISLYIFMYKYIYIYMYMYVCIYVYMYRCIYVYMYIIYISKHRSPYVFWIYAGRVPSKSHREVQTYHGDAVRVSVAEARFRGENPQLQWRESISNCKLFSVDERSRSL